MGRLERLELENFKSYKGFHTIGPFKDFTAVIGPNGSGKSNLLDAVSFVIGMSGQQLRTKHLKDFLYRSPDNVFATRAHVCMVYYTSANVEIRFTRTISSSLQSEYRINDKTVSYAQYIKAFEQENILVKAKNFLVFQGDVTSIVADVKTTTLTELIEKISGSGELKGEYDLQNRAVEEASKSLNLTQERKKTVTAEIKQYTDQRNEAQRFEQLKLEKSQLETTLNLWRLYQIEQSMNQEEQAISQITKQRKPLQKRLDQVSKEYEAVKGQKGDISDQKTVLDRSLTKKEKQMSAHHEKITEVSTGLENIAKKVENAKKDLAKEEQGAEEQQSRVVELEEQLQGLMTSERLFKEAQQKGKTIVLQAEQLNEYHRKKEEVKSQTLNDHQELEVLERERDSINKQKQQVQRQEEDLKAHADKERASRASEETRKKKVEDKIEEGSKELAQVQTSLATIRAKKADVEKKMADLESRRKDMRFKMMEISQDQRVKESTKRKAEIIKRLTQAFPDRVHGRLSSLCDVANAKFRLAVSIVLGKHIDSIVVDTAETGRDCIKYLHEFQLGIETFIPLDNIRPKEVKEKFRNQQLYPGVHLAVDVISFDPKFRLAIHHACANAIICDTMEIARGICIDRNEEVKAITLNGEIYHKDGKITGGKSESNHKAAQLDNKDYDYYKTTLANIEKEIDELEPTRRKNVKEEALMLEKQAQLQPNLTLMQSSLATITGKIQSADADLKNTEGKLEKLRAELRKLETDEKPRDTRIQRLTSNIQRVEDQVFKDFCRKIGVDNIREFEEKNLRENRELQDKEVQLRTSISRAQSLLDSTKDNLKETESKIKRLRSEVAKEEKNEKELQTKHQALQKERENMAKERDESKREIANVVKQLDEIKAKFKEVEKTKQDLESQINNLDKDISSKEAAIGKHTAERLDLLRQCKLDGIDIPYLSGTLDDEATATQDGRNIEIDFSGLNADIANDSSTQVEINFMDQIRTKSIDIERMEPNLRAVELLGDVERHAQQVNEEFERTRQEAKTAKEKFTEIKKKRAKMFQDALQFIKDKTNEIYGDLTKGSTFVHGEAHLEEENEEEPYLGGVRLMANPRGKSTREIKDLSGGERTVVALAFLFAVQSYRQAPFFVLDEVDAALDKSNLNQVVQYVRKIASSSFQVIQISLKSSMYERADALVGVYRDQESSSSGVLTMDLTDYD